MNSKNISPSAILRSVTIPATSKPAASNVKIPITASINFSVITVVQCSFSVANTFSNVFGISGITQLSLGLAEQFLM